MASVHGHDVLQMLLEAGPLPRETILEAVARRFGPDARFHTCAAAELTAGGLLDFLESRGKLVRSEAGLAVVAERVCRSDEAA